MSRHIIKVSSQAELEAAIASGLITPPYIAYDSSSNTTNLVLPSGREPASIDYEQAAEEGYLTFNNAYINEYSIESPFLRGYVGFSATINSYPDSPYTSLGVAIVPKADWDERVTALTEDLGDDPTDEEVVESFVNPNSDYYDGIYSADIIERRSMLTGDIDCVGIQSWQIPYADNDEEIEGEDYQSTKECYILAGFYDNSNYGSEYMYIFDEYELGNYLISDEDVSEEILIPEAYAEFSDMDGRTVYTWAGITQNDAADYGHFGIGLYLDSQLSDFYKSGGYKDTDEALPDFLDAGHMLTFEYEVDASSGFYNKREEIDMFDIPGYSPLEDDTVKLALWYIDENGDILEGPYEVSEIPYEADPNWYEEVDWSSSDVVEEGTKVVDYINAADSSVMQYNDFEAGFEDIWGRNWNHVYNGIDNGTACLIINPIETWDASDNIQTIIGGRVVDGSIYNDNDDYSITFSDCSVGVNDRVFLASYSDENHCEYYFIAGVYSGETMDSLEVDYYNDNGTWTLDSVTVTPISGPDSSAVSDASILSFEEHQSAADSWYPVIGTYNTDPSMNYIKVVWPARDETDDPSQAGYGSLTDLLDNYAYTYYALTSGQTTETISASDIAVDQSNVLSFYAQFVSGEEVTDEWDTTSLVVDSSKEWIQIGYFALNPYVDCVLYQEDGFADYSVQDNGDGTFEVQPYPNRDAVDAGYSYFKVGYSTDDDDVTDPSVCAYVLQNNMVNTLYTGTESNPAQVTLDIANMYGEGSGLIIAQVCDASGNFYTTDWVCDLGGWYYEAPPEEEPELLYTCPECGEPYDGAVCGNCGYPHDGEEPAEE